MISALRHPPAQVFRLSLAIAAATLLASATASSQPMFDVGACAEGGVTDVVACLEARCNGAHSADQSRDLAACVALGWRYACGEGVVADAFVAADRFILACDNGHESGCAEYEQLRALEPLRCSTGDAAPPTVAEPDRLPLGEPCTAAAECASDFCGNGRCAPAGFSYIAAGTFEMGSPLNEPGRDDDETQFTVTLTRSYFMQQTEVTQGQWRGIAERYAAMGGTLGTAPSLFTVCGDDCPVERVNWFDAVAFANAMSALEGLDACYELIGCSGTPGSGLVDGEYAPSAGAGDYVCAAVVAAGPTCSGYRLPTEAEWEYAARAGTERATYGGVLSEPAACDAQPSLGPIAWYCGNALTAYASGFRCAGGADPCGPQVVATRQPNDWGLHDMLGNVWEWCSDGYGVYPWRATVDPEGPATGSSRVLRGGSWNGHASVARSANRFVEDPEQRNNRVGFRLVRTVP